MRGLFVYFVVQGNLRTSIWRVTYQFHVSLLYHLINVIQGTVITKAV